jgi:hypothetical protein
MQFRRGPVWRRTSRVRPALIASLIAIPLAAGVAVGVIAANHSSSPTSQLKLSAHNFGIGSRLPLATGSAAGTGVDLGQTPAQAADSMNCTLQAPANPLSARGLASPYILGDGCEMSNASLQAFVEADIINPRNGRIKVYNPLVITEGTQPAAAPARPVLAPGDVVAIMFGFNGDNLLLTGTGRSLQQGNCVNGAGQSLFTQVAYCNGPAFYRAANRAIAQGLLKIPALGTGNDGQACPTVRGFDVVDQDQSDNVVTTYLINAQGQTAQDSAANVTGLPGVTAINNGSDNALVNKFMDPALGCTPYEFHDKTAAAGKSGSQITDELMAAADQAAPVALVPLNDPMTQVNGAQSMLKTNLFRLGVGQPMVSGTQTADTPANYCKNMMQVGMARAAQDEKQFSAFTTPVPDTGSNLFTFLAARLSASWGNLGCGALLNAPDPVNLTLDGNGVATAATFSPLAIGTLPGGVAPTATPSASCTATPTATPTATDTAMAAAATATATAAATATATASATGTEPAAAAPAGTPTPTPTPTAAAAATPACTAAPTATATPSGTAAPVPTPRHTGRRGWHNRIGKPHHM